MLGFLRDMDVTIVVVSSHPEAHLRKEASEYGLERHVSSFMGNMRDKEAGILKACFYARMEPAQASYTGDTIYDIQAAKKADVLSIGISTGYHTHERLASESPDLLVDSLTELGVKLAGLLQGEPSLQARL